MIATIPAAVWILGAFIFVTAKTNADLKAIGKIMFSCGLLVFLFMIAHILAIKLPA